jgi:hypothetical protein
MRFCVCACYAQHDLYECMYVHMNVFFLMTMFWLAGGFAVFHVCIHRHMCGFQLLDGGYG